MNDTLNQLPLREPTFFILLCLSPGSKHGYAILKNVETLSEGRVRLSTGTLYGAIKRLLDRGWIRRVDDPQPNHTDRQRKAYARTNIIYISCYNAKRALPGLVVVAQSQTAEETS